MDPMNPVDHVEEPQAPDTGFLFRGPGRQSRILPVLFASLIFLSGLIGFLIDDDSLWGTLVSGTAIVIVMFAANEVLKRTLRK